MTDRGPRGGDTRTQKQTARRDEAAAPFLAIVSCASGAFAKPIAEADRVLVGRGPDCDVVVDDPSVSRHHAALRTRATLEVADLGSTNGTRVNGRPLAAGATQAIEPGTMIELGGAVLVVQRGSIDAAARASSPPPRGSAPPPAPSAPASSSSSSGGARGGSWPAPAPSSRAVTPVVEDATMRRLYAMLDVVAPTPLSVLLLGETGVGKEVFAEAIHRASPRAEQPFVSLNCAALPDSVLEGELFGYEKGAFTGAVQARAGLFEAAAGGTVFLDEIGELPVATQPKLLRVLERGEVLRIGSRKPVHVDFRIVAATNRDLKAMVQAGTFRADLYFRINGMTLTLPPLRQRVADVAPLARLFVRRASERAGRGATDLDAAAARALERYDWPGNVRELRNVVERAAALSRSAILTEEDVRLAAPEFFAHAAPPPPPSPRGEGAIAPREAAVDPAATIPPPGPPLAPPPALRDEMRTLERERILQALAQTNGNQKRAAEILGISRRGLINKLDAYGIAGPRKSRA